MTRTTLLLLFVAALAGSIFATWMQTQAFGSRNSGGTYSLPAGNPVVSGTTISSTVQNNTTSDIGTELTNSLDRNGRGGMLAPLALQNGSGALPALTFTSEPASGWYRAGSHDFRFSVNGVDLQQLTSTTATYPLGVVATQSTTNGQGINAAANGTGIGAFINGGGGTTSLASVQAAISGTDGAGVVGSSNLDGGHGVIGWGTGSGSGVYGKAGGASGFGGTFDGQVHFVNSNPASTTAFTNTLTPKNMPKAWGLITTSSGTCTIQDGFNLSSCAAAGGGDITVGFASNFANSNYVISGTGSQSGPKVFYVATASTSQIVFRLYNSDFTTENDCHTNACTISLSIVGSQ